MQVHGSRRQARAQDVVLELLVREHVDQRADPSSGRDQEGHADGRRARDVRPTMGMNSDTTPSKTASGAANGTPKTRSVMYIPVPLMAARQETRVEVAARLVDGLVPDEEHALLTLGRKDAADGPSHLRPFG